MLKEEYRNIPASNWLASKCCFVFPKPVNKTSSDISLKSASEDFQEHASSIQQFSKFGDEAVLVNAALIQSLGSLEVEGLKGATQAAVDMAAALRIDLKAAATLVGKAATGEISSFTRYGLAITKGKDASETFANALRAINDQFGGAAAAQVNTFSGAVTQLGNTWGDATEEIGFAITQNEDVVEAIKETQGAIAAAIPDIGRFSKFVVGMFIGAPDQAIALQGQIEETQFKIRELQGQVERSGGGLIGKLLGGNAKEQLQEQKDLLSEFEESLNEVITARVQADRMSDESGRISVEANKEKIAVLKEDEQLFLEELLAIRGTASETEIALNDLRQAQELAKLQKFFTEKKITETKFLTAKSALTKKFDQLDKANALKKQQFERQLDQQKLAAASTFFGGMAALASLGGKKLFTITKRLAQAEAITNGVAAVQRALANPPGFPFNALAVAGVTGQTIANVAKIESTGFRHGIDRVPGIGVNDNFNAVLAPRERVVQAPANRDLTEFLDVQKSIGFGRQGPAQGGVSGRILVELTEDAHELIRARFIEDDDLGIGAVG